MCVCVCVRREKEKHKKKKTAREREEREREKDTSINTHNSSYMPLPIVWLSLMPQCHRNIHCSFVLFIWMEREGDRG